jgi:hypothetical protein
MTKQQVAAWAQALVKLNDAERTRVVVKGVKVSDDQVAKVRFTHNKVHGFYVARSNGKSPIRIRFDGARFVATSVNHTVAVAAKTADMAFAKCVQEAWAN